MGDHVLIDVVQHGLRGVGVYAGKVDADLLRPASDQAKEDHRKAVAVVHEAQQEALQVLPPIIRMKIQASRHVEQAVSNDVTALQKALEAPFETEVQVHPLPQDSQ